MNFQQQIAKAAKVLDLRGNADVAARILEEVLSHHDIDGALAVKIEALTMLADVHYHCGDKQSAHKYIGLVEELDTSSIEADLVEPHLRRITEIKQRMRIEP